MYTINNMAELNDFISYVGAFAPDSFTQRDWLEPEHQLNLERAFFLLYQGLGMVYTKKAYKDKRQDLKIILDKAYEHYKLGDRKAGLNSLHQFEDMIFGPPDKT